MTAKPELQWQVLRGKVVVKVFLDPEGEPRAREFAKKIVGATVRSRPSQVLGPRMDSEFIVPLDL